MSSRTIARGVHAHPARKLGKRRPCNKPAINFGAHLKTIPSHPITDPAPQLDYPMDKNDAWGDCVVAGWDHFCQVVYHLLGVPYTNLTDDQILQLYRTQNPKFDPNSSANGPGSDADGGMDIQLFLEYLVKQGLLVAFAKVDYTKPDELLAGIYLGISLITGIVVDQAQMQQQFDQGVWDYVAKSVEEGGHCIPLVGYQPVPQGVTWAKLVKTTLAFIDHQMEEAWIAITQAHYDHPEFWKYVDFNSFAASYTALTGRTLPTPANPTPPPAPQPTPQPVPPTPQPVPGTYPADAADHALAPELKRLVNTAHEPHYIHDAATAWLAAKQL